MASRWRRLGSRSGAALVFTLLFTSATASADPETAPASPTEATAYCARVRARASSEASLLIAPTVRAEAIKLPPSLQRSGRLDPTLGGAAYQARAGITVSPIHMYKGIQVLDAADADCAQFEAATRARDLVADALDVARLRALEKQRAFLVAQHPQVDAITAKADERFEARTSTMAEAEEVRNAADRLARSELHLAGEIARLQATASSTDPKVRVAELRTRVASTSRRFEEKTAHIRSLDAWDLSVTAGVVPPVLDQPSADVYGVVSLSWNFGGPFRNAAESRYVAARGDEVRVARASAARQLDTLVQVARAAKKQAEGELALVERRLSANAKSRAVVEQSDASAALRQLAMLDLEQISLESERAFLKELAMQLTSLEEGN